MPTKSTQVQVIQCQLKILETLILASELVEHEASWLKNVETVMRDASGRFARKAQAIQEDATALASGLGEMLKISASEISAMVKDPAFRERAGLSVSMLIGQSIGNLVAKAKIFPGLSAEIDKMIAQKEKKLAGIYGDDNTALAQSFRKVKLPQPPKDASMKEKMEFYVARYQAYDDVLKSPEFYQTPVIPTETAMDVVAKVAKASIPVAIGVGLNLAVDLAIPLLLGNPFSLGVLAATSVASYGVSEAVSYETQKALDKTGLTETQKIIADIAVRILSASAVSGVVGSAVKRTTTKKAMDAATKKAEDVAAIAKKEAEQLAKKEAEQLAKKEAEQLAKQEAEQLAKQEAEQLAKQEAAQKAAKEAAKKEAEQKAAKEAEQKAAKEAAKKEAEQKAAKEAEQKAAKEAAKKEAEQKAAKEAEQKAAKESPRKVAENAKKKSFYAAMDGYSNPGPIKNPAQIYAASTAGGSRELVIVNENELKALVDYTGRHYNRINKFMRGDEWATNFYINHERTFEEIRLASAALSRLPRVKSSSNFVRYIDNVPSIKNLKPGQIFQDPAFMSCSIEDEVIAKHSFQRNNIKIEIEPRKGGSAARDVSGISEYPEEKEVLFPANSRFKVKSVSKVPSSPEYLIEHPGNKENTVIVLSEL